MYETFLKGPLLASIKWTNTDTFVQNLKIVQAEDGSDDVHIGIQDVFCMSLEWLPEIDEKMGEDEFKKLAGSVWKKEQFKSTCDNEVANWGN